MTLVIAHRGASFDEPENTIPAFERAIEMGADYVELDVQVSGDGTLVVFHDLELDRLTPLGGPLSHRSFAELREVGVPALSDVLDVTRGRVGVMAELKSPWRYRRHDVVGRTLEQLGPADMLLSFERWALLAARRERPSQRVIQLVGTSASLRQAATYAWGVGIADESVTRRGLVFAGRYGLRSTVYTVNDPDRMRELRDAGVGGIFTDRPDLARAALATAVPTS